MPGHHRIDIHFWNPELREPPCGTLEDRFEWSDAIEDVTCEACRQALAADDADAAPAAEDESEHPSP